jgi:hypothetical protein
VTSAGIQGCLLAYEVGEEGGGDEVAEAGELPLLLLRRRHLLILLELRSRLEK